MQLYAPSEPRNRHNEDWAKMTTNEPPRYNTSGDSSVPLKVLLRDLGRFLTYAPDQPAREAAESFLDRVAKSENQEAAPTLDVLNEFVQICVRC